MFVPGRELDPAFLSGLLNFIFSFFLLCCFTRNKRSEAASIGGDQTCKEKAVNRPREQDYAEGVKHFVGPLSDREG
jgi:hypothetical protein